MPKDTVSFWHGLISRKGDSIFMNENKYVFPFYQKHLLTVYEASRYFNIGEKKFHQIITENAGCEWMLYNGSRIMIKKERFAKWLDKQTVI